MLPGQRLQTLLILLGHFSDRRQPADKILSHYLKENRSIGAQDRRWISQHFFQCFRLYFTLQESVPHVPHDFLQHHSKAWLLTYLQKTEPMLLDLFCSKPSHPEPLSKADLNFLEQIDPRELSSTSLFCPFWLRGDLTGFFGDNSADQAASWTTQPPVHLRINTLKSRRTDILKELDSQGLEAFPSPFSPWGIHLSSKIPQSHRLLKEGFIECQDEGSQLIAMACQPGPYDNVLDLCAGAGGKTLALAALMNNKGRLAACDIFAWRLKRAQERLRRAGVHNAHCRLLDGAGEAWLKRQHGRFDCVLVDAPCSGTGTWRRNPDAALRLHPQDLIELKDKQQSLLQIAAKLVKSGGRVIYATCSWLPSENQDQIAWFLETHGGSWSLGTLPLDQKIMDCDPINNPKGMVNLTPLNHGTDGYFIAILQKK